MKRLFTTAMVLVMIATVFCASPVAMATDTPKMSLSLFNSENGSDEISVDFSGVKDASWVVLSITDELTGEYIYIGEKKGNRAETEGISFDVDSANRVILEDKEYIAEAKITLQDGSIITCSQTFEYNTFSNTQTILGDMFAGTKAIIEATADLVWPIPDYYVSDTDVDNAILANLEEFYNLDTTVDRKEIYNKMIDEILLASLNSGNASVIENILDSHYETVTISAIDTEKLWYDSLPDKNAVATKLANYTYGSIADFKEQFKTVVFLAKLSLTALDDRIKFLEDNNNKYQNYGTNTHLNGASETTNLDFDTPNYGYKALAKTSDHRAYAAQFMAGTYETLSDLKTKFTQLLAGLLSFTPPTDSTDVSDSSSGITSSTTVSVGSIIPVVGTTPIPFTDIESVEWAKEAIIALANEGVIEGVAPRQYQPNANVTREQFVKIIVKTFFVSFSLKSLITKK